MTGSRLAATDVPPAVGCDVALLDLDGVLYVGDDSVPHAAAALSCARELGMRAAFVTNNALRTPQQVAAKLHGVGVEARAAEVVTSAQAAATVLRDRLGRGGRVLVTGGEGLQLAVQEAGFVVVAGADDSPAAVVLGFDPTLDYARLAEASLAVRRGALFVAANRDATIPSARGLLPGMGALTALVVTGSGCEPVVAGKPERALHAESIARSGARRPLVVGDRLDTDIEGARRAGTPSLLVLTGVSDLAELAAAPPERRPDLLAPDLRGLLEAHPGADSGSCGSARARWDSATDAVIVDDPGSAPGQGVRAWVTAAWAACDAAAGAGRPRPSAGPAPSW